MKQFSSILGRGRKWQARQGAPHAVAKERKGVVVAVDGAIALHVAEQQGAAAARREGVAAAVDGDTVPHVAEYVFA